MSKDKISYFPRAVRSIPDPLGFYIRPEHRDQKVLLDFFSSHGAPFSGVIFNPVHLHKQKELLEQVLDRKIDAILDPKTQELASIGRYNEKLGNLPWGLQRQHNYDDYKGMLGQRIVKGLSDFAIEKKFTQIIAPTHYLQNADSEWLDIDIRIFNQLQNQLAKTDDGEKSLIYSLTIPYAAFRDQGQRSKIINALRSTSADMLWLKIDGMGSDNTANATCSYLKAVADFHSLEIPIVADHMGGLPGLSLLAFGAVGGLAHGITLRERFSANDWNKPSNNKGRLPQRRVYVSELDMMLDAKAASKMFEALPRVRSMFGCKDKSCCPRGVKDMIEDPARHFLIQRSKQISSLSNIPEQLRPQEFLNKQLLPITDRVLKAANYDWDEDTAMARKVQKHRQRLDKIRISLGEYMDKLSSSSYSPHPIPRAAREASSR